MLNSRQRAYLRSQANSEDTIVYIGKAGITDTVVSQTVDALRARELIKCKVQEGAGLTTREACDELSERCGAESVQVIGSKFVLFKRNPERPQFSSNLPQ